MLRAYLFRIVDTPTHLRYYVKEEDLRAYMKQSVTESKKEFTRGQFSSRNTDAPKANEASGAEISVFAYLSRKDLLCNLNQSGTIMRYGGL